MDILNSLFCCSDNHTQLPPTVMHKTISSQIDSDDFHAQMWVKRSTDIHSKFDYKLCELLGQGASGKVYLAEAYDPSLHTLVQRCAVKVLSKSKLEQQSNYKKYLLLEKRVQSEVKSNFILKFIESFQSKSHCFISLEFAEGGTVFTFLDSKRRKLIEYKLQEAIRFIAACVFLGLKSLHSNDYVYRDLKPQNLLIDGNGYVKLSDFGLSDTVCDDEIINGCRAGTLPYFAPEMQLKLGHNKLVDFWCLGVLIYELFTKKTPFTNTEINNKSFKQIVKIAECSNKFQDPNIPPVAQDLIKKLLRAEKEQRIGSKSIDDIKNHQFFNNIDWEALESHRMESPLLESIRECSTEYTRSRKCSSNVDDQGTTFQNVSLFTTEGSPMKAGRTLGGF